jgi:hypothetical protein
VVSPYSRCVTPLSQKIHLGAAQSCFPFNPYFDLRFMKIHTLTRRALLPLAAAALLLSQSPAQAQNAANYPERPVRIVVPFAPGAGTDAMGRLVALKLGEILGGSFVVDNRAGASGAIGTQHVA